MTDYFRGNFGQLFLERRACSPDEWQCTNRQCITNQQRCDFVENCFDKSDEIDCGKCMHNLFLKINVKSYVMTS